MTTILDRLDELEKRAAKARAILASNSCQTAAEFDAAEADMAAVQQPAIRNLRALIEAARALAPFALCSAVFDDSWHDNDELAIERVLDERAGPLLFTIKVGQLRQARAALAPLMEKADG